MVIAMIKLMEHQKKELELYTENEQFAVFGEPGTGKTLPILYHITNLAKYEGLNSALIVCPLYVMGSWQRDIDKLPTWRKEITQKVVHVINYDKVWRRPLYEEYWDFICLDEAHNIAYTTSRRTQWAIGKGKKKGANSRSRWRYILTGTPLDKGKLEQYWPMFEFLIPGYLGTHAEFTARYLIQRQIPGSFVRFTVGYRNKDELLQLVSAKSYAVRKKDCLDLPEKLEPELITVDNPNKAIYKEAEHSCIEELLMNFDNPLVKIAKLRQIAGGFIIDEFGETKELKPPKINTLTELIESILPEKMVIFYNYKYSFSVITKLLEKMKVPYVSLNGDTKDKLVWKTFQEHDEIKVFIGQYKSAKEGIDLFAANHVIFYEPCLDTKTLTQASDRCHRIGQTLPVSYYHIITKGTIEEKIIDGLFKGEDFNAQYIATIINKRK